MNGLVFETPPAAPPASAWRNDLVCFVGQVAVREGDPPADLSDWLRAQGWWAPPGVRALRPDTLYDLPLPVASWERFDRLFAWERRPHAEGVFGAAYLAAAVRAFFAQGGRQCYVISVAEPLPPQADAAARAQRLALLVPPERGQRSHREQWHGLHHLFGLPEVALVALPDLPELVAEPPGSIQPAPPRPAAPQPDFLPCSEPAAPPVPDRPVQRLEAPRCSDAGYGTWQAVLRRALRWIGDWRRDLMLLAALPLPQHDSEAARDPAAFLDARGWFAPEGELASARLQLAWPWLRGSAGPDLPQGLEPPDGALAGLLARNALVQGAFRNATPLAPQGLVQTVPALDRSARNAPLGGAPLQERLCLWDDGPQGLRLRSDVTTAPDPLRRQGGVARTLGLVLRAARRIGEEFVFEPAGETLWARVERRLGELLARLQAAGALHDGPGGGFGVRCDRSTMSAADIDAGRVIAHAWIRPAAGIERLHVRLVLGDGRVAVSADARDAA